MTPRTPDTHDDAGRRPAQITPPHGRRQSEEGDGAWATPHGRRQLFVVAAADFIVWAGGGAIFPYLPVFLQKEAGASLWWIGVIAAAYFIGVFTVSPLAGRLSDRVGRKPLLVGGTLLYGLSTLLFITTTSPALFVLFRLLEGVSVALVVPAGQAFIAEITTDRNRSQAYGWWTTAQFGGLLIGPALAWPLYELGGGQGIWAFYSIFIFGSVLSFVAAGALAVFIREPEHAIQARRQPAQRPPLRELLNAPILAILLVVATAEFTMGAWEVVWSIWLDSQGRSFAFIGLTWIAFSAPMLLSFAGGRLADRHSRYALMIAGFAVQGAMWIVFSLTELPVVYIAAAMVGGLAFALAFPAKQALLVQVSPPRWLGSVQGIEQMSMQGAAFVGTLTAPLIYGAIGGWVFAVGGAVALTGVVVAAPVLRREWACLRRGGVRSCAQLETVAAGSEESGSGPVVGELPAEAETG
jgi:DHA1 family multidrug resistance protein-like MFS transporter